MTISLQKNTTYMFVFLIQYIWNDMNKNKLVFFLELVKKNCYLNFKRKH